jgi:hypothetical protein
MSMTRFQRGAAIAASALLGAVLAAAAAAAPPRAEPLPQAQAVALAGGPAAVSSGSVTRRVSAQEALAAAALPGALVAVAPGLSLGQAVGVAPAVAAALTACSANAAWHEWGTWPYQQRITDTTYWCAVYNRHITYRSSSATGSGTLCATNYAASQLIGGGVGRGFTYFTVRSSAGFACQTVIPWITIHTNHHEDVKRNDVGRTTWVGTG